MLTLNLENFLEKNRPYMNEVSQLLSHRLPEEPPPLIEHVSKIIVHRARISVLLAEMNSLLDLAEREALPPKTAHTTELDRELTKNSAVREYRMWRDILSGILSSIDSTRTWAQSALAFERHAPQSIEGGGP